MRTEHIPDDAGNPTTVSEKQSITPFKRLIVSVASIIVDADFDQKTSRASIDMLAAIVAKYGLRDPITITVEGRLVAGARWFAAIKKLGWETVEVVVVGGAA
jgi:ParB-like chromosome segregation protein Spo0J